MKMKVSQLAKFAFLRSALLALDVVAPLFVQKRRPAPETGLPRREDWPVITLRFDKADEGDRRKLLVLEANGDELLYVRSALALTKLKFTVSLSATAGDSLSPLPGGALTVGVAEGAAPADCEAVFDALVAAGFKVRTEPSAPGRTAAPMVAAIVRAEERAAAAQTTARELDRAVEEALAEEGITHVDHSPEGVKQAIREMATTVAAKAQLPYLRAQMTAIGGGDLAAGVARFNKPAPERRLHHADDQGRVPSGFPLHVTREGEATYPPGTVFTPVAPPLDGGDGEASSMPDRKALNNPMRILEALAELVDEDDCDFQEVEGRQTCKRAGCRRCESERARALLERALDASLAVEVRRRALLEAAEACRTVELAMQAEVPPVWSKPITRETLAEAFAAVAVACRTGVEKLLVRQERADHVGGANEMVAAPSSDGNRP